jgi:hypothetical protein
LEAYVPSGTTEFFESPNFGASFYDLISDNGELFFPPENVLNDEKVVSQQADLLGSPEYFINRLAVGFIHQPISTTTYVSAVVSINGITVSNKIIELLPQDEIFGVQLDGLFDVTTCPNDPCQNTLEYGDTIKITLSKTTR